MLNLHNFKPDVLGFSICSASNYKFALDIIKNLSLSKLMPIILGGQHMRPPTNRKSDIYTASEGDLERIGVFYGKDLNCENIESIDYSIVPYEYLYKYYPSVEVSRGCWNHCQFCNSDNLHIEKDVKRIEKELRNLSILYPKDTIVTLAESNNILTNWRRRGLLDLLKDYGSYFRFNFNLGIESGWEQEWDEIINLNLWNVFVGIESCDKDTLVRMQKTKSPIEYIRKASEFLRRCKCDGVHTFATYIYGYPGQTVNEIDALDDFLLAHACNNIVQTGFPCEAYPGTNLLMQRSKYEGIGVKYHKVYPDDIEYYHLDISSYLTHEYLQNRANNIQYIINTKDKFTLERCKGKFIKEPNNYD